MLFKFVDFIFFLVFFFEVYLIFLVFAVHLHDLDAFEAEIDVLEDVFRDLNDFEVGHGEEVVFLHDLFHELFFLSFDESELFLVRFSFGGFVHGLDFIDFSHVVLHF